MAREGKKSPSVLGLKVEVTLKKMANIDVQPNDDDQFYRDLSKDDSLTVTIKAAIHVEQQLERLLRASLHDYEILSKIEVTYSQRVHLAVACGLQRRFLSPLNALGVIRNKFAHELREEVTKSDMDSFYNAFSPDEKQVVQNTYARVRKDMPGAKKRPKRLENLPPLDRFQLYVTALRGALIVAARHAAEMSTIRVARGDESTS